MIGNYKEIEKKDVTDATPQYRFDLDILAVNLAEARKNTDLLGIKLLLALKAFPMPSAFSRISSFLDGSSASGLYEARLGRELNETVFVHASTYTDDEIEDICNTATYVVFNSVNQLKMYGGTARKKGCSIGLRINPEFSISSNNKYDTCTPNSRFGVLKNELTDDVLDMIDGIHLHVLCDSDADGFVSLLRYLRDNFGREFSKLKWLNLGGGMNPTAEEFRSEKVKRAVSELRSIGNFELWIEPGKSVTEACGTVIATVLEVMRREKDIAVLDISAVCHIPGVLLAPYMPEIASPRQAYDGVPTKLCGNSCLASDIFGVYGFERPLKVGDKIVFSNMGSYNFAQQSRFNGMKLPSMVIVSAGKAVCRRYTFEEYRTSLV